MKSIFSQNILSQSILVVFGLVLANAGISQGLPKENIGSNADKAASRELGIEQNLGAQLPEELAFLDENGKSVQLNTFFKNKPIILMPVFYNCTSACMLSLDESIKTFIKMRDKGKYAIGKNYDVLVFSIHPKETPELALIKKTLLLKKYKDQSASPSWHFLTGSQESISKLTKIIGFRYSYDPIKDSIQHPSGFMVLTPKGRISSYFFGVQYEPKLLRDALIAAGKNEIGIKAEPLFFGCIGVDPITGQKSINILNTVRLFGVVTLVVLIVSIIMMNRKSKMQYQATSSR
jgi:protein SCO1/2